MLITQRESKLGPNAMDEGGFQIKKSETNQSTEFNEGVSTTVPTHGWRTYAAFGTLCLVTFIVALDSTIICVAIPTIAEDINASAIEAFWCGTSFLLASTVIQPPIASLSHVFGRLPAILSSLTLFTVGSIVAALAKNVSVLLAGRTLQGLGSGGIVALTYVIATDLVSLRERGKWFSLISLTWTLGSIMGPLIGGALVATSWPWLFWINLPFCGLAYIAIPLTLRIKRKGGISTDMKLKEFDWIGSVVFIGSLTSFLIPLSWGGVMYDWSSPRTAVPLAIGIVGIIGFGFHTVYSSKYSRCDPLIRPSLFTSLTSVTAFFATVIHGIIAWCIIYYVPLYHEIRGSSALDAGVALLPFTGTVAPGAMLVGLLVTKTGLYRPFVWMGWFFIPIGIGLLMMLERQTETWRWVLIYLTGGIGLGVLYSAQAFACQAGASNADLPFASGLYAFCRNLGQCIGVAVGGVAFQNEFEKQIKKSSQFSDKATEWAKDASALVQVVRKLPPDMELMKDTIINGYIKGLRIVWLVLCALACVGLVASLLGISSKTLDREFETEHGLADNVRRKEGELTVEAKVPTPHRVKASSATCNPHPQPTSRPNVNANVDSAQHDMASASPFSSELSSPASFVTARDSGVDKSTAASSPVQDNPCPYRDARQLPRELKAHCQIFLEEQLYTCAINLLNSVAGSGASKRASTNRKSTAVPPPNHLALLATLVVHPLHTTRAEKKEHLDVPSQALDYLRNLLTIVGPINAGFRTAFRFHSIPRFGRKWGHHTHANDSDASDGDVSVDDEQLRGKISNEGSLWSRGQDFWSTVGWAFNCSTLYPHRWQYWKVWLGFMLDVLEADWNERERIDKEAHRATSEDGEMPRESREEAIILMYMDQQDGRTHGNKGILKALFADGSEISSSAFREIFDKEPKGPRKQVTKRKREQVLDLENDKFGDYFEDESQSSGISEPPTPQKPKDTRKSASAGAYQPGLVESISFRLRLFKLLSAATHATRKRSDLDRLYEGYATSVKLLPLQTFALLVSQRPNPLIAAAHITITKELFHILLPYSYKNPAKVDREADSQGCLTTPMLEQCYILNPANTVAVDDNAKLSLVVENAIQLLWTCEMLEYSESFAEAAEKGIKARETKAKKRRTGKMKGDATDSVAQDVLEHSGQRIRILLEALKTMSEVEE
ncbi:hypothetical protein G7Z17_g11808 [Cylindrodendrum hubeiense]|uniref:Major facilitator superfamily (MFS) profile domain-containing protein n=1 Tax=Cylindrodendrum hubeiense TaxID=595255 RepID=A0A9P5GV88_9HYPO|nr:hypothetical protein G7Z17_g11808 [Cylindrodendrum hubeiense]